MGWTGTHGLFIHVGTLCESDACSHHWISEGWEALLKRGPQAAQLAGSIEKPCQGWSQRDWLIIFPAQQCSPCCSHIPPGILTMPAGQWCSLTLPASHTPDFQPQAQSVLKYKARPKIANQLPGISNWYQGSFPPVKLSLCNSCSTGKKMGAHSVQLSLAV